MDTYVKISKAIAHYNLRDGWFYYESVGHCYSMNNDHLVHSKCHTSFFFILGHGLLLTSGCFERVESSMPLLEAEADGIIFLGD